jgi:hypothetical protein
MKERERDLSRGRSKAKQSNRGFAGGTHDQVLRKKAGCPGKDKVRGRREASEDFALATGNDARASFTTTVVVTHPTQAWVLAESWGFPLGLLVDVVKELMMSNG